MGLILPSLSSKILNRWESVKATHYPTRFGSPKHCGIGNVLKEFASLRVVAIEMGKKYTISVTIATLAKKIKYFIKTMNLVHSNSH